MNKADELLMKDRVNIDTLYDVAYKGKNIEDENLEKEHLQNEVYTIMIQRNMESTYDEYVMYVFMRMYLAGKVKNYNFVEAYTENIWYRRWCRKRYNKLL